MKIIIDHGRCQGHATCVIKGPHVYELNDEGYNRMSITKVPPHLEEEAHAGMLNCLEGAIRISSK